jgi:heat shock protein HslJ
MLPPHAASGVDPMTARLLAAGLLVLLAGCSQVATSAPPSEPVPSSARWGLHPAALPAPADRSIRVDVWEVPCSGGRAITGKILPPEVDYEPERVVVTLWLEPLPVLGPNEALTCPLAPPVPYTVELSEPLGERELVDGNQAIGGDASWGGMVDPALMGRWQLVEGTLNGEAFAPVAEAPVTLAIRADAAVGNGGCNAYSAEPVTVRSDGITIPTPSGHLAACPDGRGDAEALFFRALPRVSAWKLVAGRLDLSGDGALLTFRRPPAADCEPRTYCSEVWIRVVGTDATDPLPTTYELWVGEHAYELTPEGGDGVASVGAPSPLRVRLLEARTCAAVADFTADPGKYLVISIDDASNVQIQDLTGSSRMLGPGLAETEKPAC